MERKPLTVNGRKDLRHQWKVLAGREQTTMSGIAERLIAEYLREKGG